jgi:hypothetical protein
VEKMWATFAIFKKTTQTKQSPIGRKFDQSGHPVRGQHEKLKYLSCHTFADARCTLVHTRKTAAGNREKMMRKFPAVFSGEMLHSSGRLSPHVLGCQIFLGATYQNGKNIPNNHKIYHMSTKYTK